MPIKKIRYAQVLAQVSEGALTPYAAATKQASFVLEGRTLANLVYQISGKVFNEKEGYFAVPRIDGVVSGCELTSFSNDNIEIAPGVANVAGVSVTVGADATNSFSRPASSKYAVYAVTVSSAGTLAITKGTDGDSLDLTGGYDGAGQKPYVDGVAVLGYFYAYGDTAGTIPTSQFLQGETANLEYQRLPLHGAIKLTQALPLNRTGGISRPVYIQYRDLLATGVMQAMGTVSDGTLTITKDAPQEVTNHDSLWKQYESTGVQGWSLSATKYRSDQYWVDKMLNPNEDTFLLKVREDSGDSYYFLGFGVLNGGLPLAFKRGAVSEALNFQGTGELRRITG